MTAINQELTHKGITKIAHYNWRVQDKPGEFRMLSKRLLLVDPDYQRHGSGEARSSEKQVRNMASAWSWVACGTITVGERNGEYWVIEGYHRVLAARKRSDIDLLPCMVFQTESQAQEAQGFWNANIKRKSIGGHDKYRALLVAEDTSALALAALLRRYDISLVKSGAGPLQTSAAMLLLRLANQNLGALDRTLSVLRTICTEMPLHEALIDGLYYIDTHVECTLADSRLRDKVEHIGAERLLLAAKRAASIFSKGGAKQWAIGMLEDINKGLRTKHVLSDQTTNN